jgi:hypothetical protein
VQEFNKGVYDYIIATDESGGKSEKDTDDEDEDDDEKGEDQGDTHDCTSFFIPVILTLWLSFIFSHLDTTRRTGGNSSIRHRSRHTAKFQKAQTTCNAAANIV